MRKLQRKLKVPLTSIPKLSVFLLAPVVAIITYLEGSTANIYTFMWIHICIHRKIFSVVFIYRKGNTVNNTSFFSRAIYDTCRFTPFHSSAFHPTIHILSISLMINIYVLCPIFCFSESVNTPIYVSLNMCNVSPEDTPRSGIAGLSGYISLVLFILLSY